MSEYEGIVIPGEEIYYAHVLDPEFKKLELPPTSDVHYGNHLFSLHHFQRHIQYLLDTPNTYTFLCGDLCESSIRTSKGDIFKQVGSPKDQRDWMIEKLMPIKHKILGAVAGNHENRIRNETSMDITEDIAKALNIPYRNEGMLVKISFGSGNDRHDDRPYTYFGYFTHGYGGARTASSKAVKVERSSSYIHASFYCMSHDHVANAAPVIYLMPDNRTKIDEATGFTIGKIIANRKMLIKSNAYVKWGGYSELGGFSPSDLETPIIMMAGEGKPKVRVLV